ncbi:MAG: hypothetical protein JW863_16995 [Chitinispirillaceae bacterium]|nr:hypothetical protein [Chitinispirillaceae bacterium]
MHTVPKIPTPSQWPTLREVVRMVASLGGFLGRKRDGEPGAKTIGIGFQHLDDLPAMNGFMELLLASEHLSALCPACRLRSRYGNYSWMKQ